MTDPLRKRRDVDEAGRQREVDAGIPVGPQVEAGLGAVRSLQQTAGNAAVASLLGGSSDAVTAGPQRAPAKPGDELMQPGAEAGAATATAAPAPVPTPAAATLAGSGQPAAAPAPSADGFEASLFEQSVLGPLRSLYATVRDVPPDFDMALGHLRPLGVALKEYEDRFRGRDEGLANAFYAARGWLSGAYFEIQRRTGGPRPMSDADIAERVQNVLDDLKGVQDRLR